MIRSVYAQCTVTELGRAEDWYTRLFGREPDTRPMPGLIEWHLGETFGVQVWSEPDRSGNSTMVLHETDLDAAADHTLQAGIHHDGPQPGGGARILPLTDPDGNRVVITGS